MHVVGEYYQCMLHLLSYKKGNDVKKYILIKSKKCNLKRDFLPAVFVVVILDRIFFSKLKGA